MLPVKEKCPDGNSFFSDGPRLDFVMKPTFHLSIGVRSLDESIDFFTRVLTGTVIASGSGYVNIDLFGSQITLKENKNVSIEFPDFHFGINIGLDQFERLAQNILDSNYQGDVSLPNLIDAGTPLERKKMYLKCPTGYLIEIKGYNNRS